MRRRQRRVGLSVEQLELRNMLSASSVQTLFRSGQTFITWQEDTSITGEKYNVYQSSQPITSANLGQATLLTGRWGPLPKGTSIDANERTRGADAVQQNYIISDLGPQLSNTTGLFVNTAHGNGPEYYAVTEVVNGVEDRGITPGQNATTTAVNEVVETPSPVLVYQTPDGRGKAYTQFMDYAQWNPTFDGYAYNYSVATPDGYNGSQAVPLMVYMNGYGGRYAVHDGTPYGWNSIWVEVDDPHQSWYYGFDSSYDYRQGGVPATGTIVNFTEQRILQAIDETSARYNVDPNRIWGHGNSMGGSGLLALAMRYPTVFSAVYAGLPMTNYATSADQGGTNWVADVTPKWGALSTNLPIENLGPHAAGLAKYNGMGVWDWQNHQEQLVNHAGDSMAYVTFAHAMQDTIINWATQGAPFVGALEQGRIGYTGANVPGGHSWPGFIGSDQAMIGGPGGFGNFQFAKNMSFPAISKASSNPPANPPASTTTSYLYNQNIEWSTPWNSFDQNIVDQPNLYRISLRSTGGSQTADVTPRRLQQFQVTPGATFQWENHRVSDGALVASGTVTADSHGLVTVTGFQISAGGNRLVLAPTGTSITPPPTQTPPPPAANPPSALGHLSDTSNTIGLFADQLPGGLSDALARFITAHYAGTQKMLQSDTNRFRALNPNWVELHYQLATASGPVQYIHNGQWTSDWSSVTTHEDWFMHNPTGQRLHDSQWNWDQNDISNPAWQQHWLDTAIADMRAEGSLGVFADSFDAGVGSFWYDQTDPRFSGTNAANPSAWPNGQSWTQQLGSLINYVEAGLAATPEHFLYLPNLGSLVTSWENIDYSHVDGGMLEGFGEWGGGYLHGSASDWALSMNRALPLTGADKFIIMQPTLAGTPDSAVGQLHREFLLGTYLLLKGNHTYLNIVGGGGGLQANYFPEYNLDLGSATTPLANDVSQYLWNGVYRRDFQKGLVLVNPSPNTVTISLGGTYQQVTGSGGGPLGDGNLDAQGNYVGGSLTYTPVTTVTLAPGSAAILLNGTTSTPPTTPPPTTPPTISSGAGTLTLRNAQDNVLTNFQDQHANLGASDQLQFFKQGTSVYRPLLQFDLSSLPAGATITGARVELYHLQGLYANAPMNVDTYTVASTWAQGNGWDHFSPGAGSSWLNSDTNTPWKTPGGDLNTTTNFGHGSNGLVSSTTIASFTSAGWVSFDVTAAARAWANGTLANHGLALSIMSGDNTEHDFASSEYSNAAFRPRLVLDYTFATPPTPASLQSSGGQTPVSTPTPPVAPSQPRTPLPPSSAPARHHRATHRHSRHVRHVTLHVKR